VENTKLPLCVAPPFVPTAEGSSSRGILVEDVFQFPDTAGRVVADSGVRLVFGCEEGETGEIYR